VARTQYLTTEQAASILGVSKDLFEKVAAAEDWCKPVYMARKAKRWLAKDVFCLAHILSRRAAERPPEKGPAGG
jgi:hypothetical protein